MNNETNNPLPEGETLNDRLRRAAAMARQRTAVPGVTPRPYPKRLLKPPPEAKLLAPRGITPPTCAPA